jgi:hypothetical protein
MKKLNLILAGLALAGAATTSMAATSLSDSFDVNITFTGSCRVKTAAADFIYTYAAFDPNPRNDTHTTVFECSRGLAPTFAFDATNGTSNGAKAVTVALKAEGVISGIRYTLTGNSSKSTVGTAASAGAGGTGGSDGSADEYSVDIVTDIAAGQAGTGAGGSAVAQTRTLTITY